ncbi:MAG: universal stress protein, partial [Candidatus Latescibacteria bacterium]|nr:universal stress protein [Candidatus Latescibacterota bacterium]NIO78143.1 universal stress protein [Candidatus Latescibacterota bacterium]
VRVHDLPLSSYFATEDYIPDLRQLSQRLEEEAKNYLETKARQLRVSEVANVSTLAVSGKAAEKIIDVAWKTNDNLVMMCTHGRSGIGRWVIGSVTSRVVRHSNDPVLVIRASNRE